MAKDLSAVIIKDLKTRTIGRKVFYLPRVASTMDIARQEALKGAAEGTIVITGEQTGGRGRFTHISGLSSRKRLGRNAQVDAGPFPCHQLAKAEERHAHAHGTLCRDGEL